MRWLRRISFGVLLLCLPWALWLAVFGGFDTRLFGFSITSNQPSRPVVLGTLALFVFLAVGPGYRKAWLWLDGSTADGARSMRVAYRLLALVLAGGLAALTLVYSTTSGGGADSYGYLSQAELWASGRMRVEQPWVAELPWPSGEWSATPLGYLPAETGQDGVIIPAFSPGLPLLMASAKLLFGHGAVFWIVPLSSLVLVLATFAIGERFGSPLAGLGAAWFVATSPAVAVMSTAPMTDVPAAAAWTLAFYLGLRGGSLAGFLAGVVVSVAIAIRPNLIPLALPIAVVTATRGPQVALSFVVGWRSHLRFLPTEERWHSRP